MSSLKYIEVIGLPGVGKTTVSNVLVERLNEKSVASYKRSPLNPSFIKKIKILFGVLIALITKPVLFKVLFSSISADYKKIPSTKKVIRNIKTRLLTEIVIVSQMLKSKEEVFVNDEGLIGRLVVLSLITNLKEDFVIKLIKNILPENTTVLYITTSIDDAVNRTFDRNTFLPFFHEMEDEFRYNFYKLNTNVYEKVYGSLEKDKLQITNTKSQEDLDVEISNIISQL
jgi:thymidylate kinase